MAENLNQEMQRFEQELHYAISAPFDISVPTIDEAELFLRKQTFQNNIPPPTHPMPPRIPQPQLFTQFVPPQLKHKGMTHLSQQTLPNNFLQHNPQFLHFPPSISDNLNINFSHFPNNLPHQVYPSNFTSQSFLETRPPSPPKIIAAPSIRYNIPITNSQSLLTDKPNDRNNPLAYTFVPRKNISTIPQHDSLKFQSNDDHENFIHKPKLSVVQGTNTGSLVANIDQTKLTKIKKKKNKKKKEKGKGKDSTSVQRHSSNAMPPKHKIIVRYEEGSCWMDPSLLDWDPNDYRIFCGDLGNEVTDEVLARAFNRYPSFQRAKVIRDKRNNKTKGFGFVSFKDALDYAKAMKEMNGRYVGGRPIKLRKSVWRDRCIDVVRKRVKEKQKLVNQIKAL